MLDSRPNVVFIMLDTVRADYLKGYGGSMRLRTLDGIAEKGVLYENVVAPGTYTVPSHASLFLGKRVKRIKSMTKDPLKEYNKVIDPYLSRSTFVGPRDSTIASKMESLGYESSLFSNNPFVSSTTGMANGFSYIEDIWLDEKVSSGTPLTRMAMRIASNSKVRNGSIRASYLISRLMTRNRLDRFYLDMRKRVSKGFAERYGFYRLDDGAAKINRLVAKYLEKGHESKKFMFINYMEGHEGYPTNLVTRDYIEQDKWFYLSGIMGPEPAKKISDAYKKRLVYADGQAGKLLDMLRANGTLDNAIVIFASDHGQAFMEHGLMYHNMFPFEEIAKVPLVVAKYADGKQVAVKERVSSTVSLTALHDSIANIGYGTEDDINGNLRRDGFVFSDHVGITEVWDAYLLKLLKARSKSADAIYRAKMQHNTFATAVYYKNYKLMLYGGRKGPELYDLKEDRSETENLIGKRRTEAHAMIRAEMGMN